MNSQRRAGTSTFLVKRSLVLVGFALATACASFPPATDDVAAALASVRGAEEVGAEDVPKAALELQLAREEVSKAQALLKEGEHENAHYQALRASNDADLAIALVREDTAKNGAKTAEKRVDDAAAEVTP